MQKVRFFCDMDGTIVRWKTATIDELSSKDYFRNIEPNINMLNAIKKLAECDTHETYILSSYLTDSAYAKQDKDDWNSEHIPEIPYERRIYVPYGTPKHLCVPNGIQPNDFLLDDLTSNLLEWSKHAHGIKCINGRNHTRRTWTGPCVSTYDSPTVIVTKLLRLINSIKE